MNKILILVAVVAALLVAGCYFYSSAPESGDIVSDVTLSSQTWTWVKTTYNNDTELIPLQAEAFSLTFKEGGTFSATTDCNSMSGAYEIEENRITFGNMITTLMYCEGSQEQEFGVMLNEVHSFFFTDSGELVFDLKYDTGSSVFR